jgi:hypothetical protein
VSIVSVLEAGWEDELARLLKLALLRAKGLSKHLQIPGMNNKITAARNIFFA